MKPLHSIAQMPLLPLVQPVAPAPMAPRQPTPISRRAEIQRGWIAEARRVLALDADEIPPRHRWLCERAGEDCERFDERNLAELGRWALQLGDSHCRRAAEIAAARFAEHKGRGDARRKVERSLRELRLFLTARQRQVKRQRRATLLSQLSQVVDRYRMAHPERAETEIAAAVRELLAGLAAGRKTAH
jgi:hypothetical protein